MSVLPPIEQKAAYVERMFARIAPGYDRMNRVMTFGLDQGWRKLLVDSVAPIANGRALDVGTGTGDFLPMLSEWVPKGVTVGVDFCVPMMVEGLPKLERLPEQVSFSAGDALKLPFASDSFDVITTGFAMRNVVDIDEALREMYRVARPGGMMACLEVARPKQWLIRFGHKIYFEGVVPWIGALLNGDRNAYTYLPQSARAFPSPDRLAEMMSDAGWKHVKYRLLGMGAVALHTAVKL